MKRLWHHNLALVAVFILLPALAHAGPIGLEARLPDLPRTDITDQPVAVSSAQASTERPLLLEKVVVEGNRRLREEAILSAVRLSPGDTVNVNVLERERLRLLDIFRILSDVNFSTRPGSTRGTAVLEIEVVERKTFSLETGYGYHDVDGWFLTLVGLRFDQPYETDSQLRFGLRLGFHLVSLDAEWENPPPVDGGIGYDARFYVHGEDRRFFGSGAPQDSGAGEEGTYTWNGPGWTEFRQNITRGGGELSALYRLRDTRFSFGARVESVEPDSTFLDVERERTREFEDLPDIIKQDTEKSVITGLFFRVTRDTRDDVIYPRSGSLTLLSMEANNTILGGDEIFTKVKLDFRKLTNLGSDRVLSGRLNAGITSSGTPYYERFTLGGIYSIRGFRELSLSPTGGDDGFWTVSSELRFPLIQSTQGAPLLSGLVFIDAGQGWERGTAFSTDNLQCAAGYGVRLRLPWLGALGFDVGLPISAGLTDEKFRVHGSVGFSF